VAHWAGFQFSKKVSRLFTACRHCLENCFNQVFLGTLAL
jgi:hypothetical protein